MDCLPVAEEGVEVDRVELLEEDGYLDVGLEVGFGFVAKLGVSEFV